MNGPAVSRQWRRQPVVVAVEAAAVTKEQAAGVEVAKTALAETGGSV